MAKEKEEDLQKKTTRDTRNVQKNGRARTTTGRITERDRKKI